MSSSRTSTGVLYVGDDVAHRLRRIALGGGAVVTVALALLALGGWLPRNPEGDWFSQAEVVVQLGLLGVVAIGLVVASRWPAPGAALLALGGVGLAVTSAIAHPPAIAVIVAAAFTAPAVMLWVVWQRRETLGRIAVLAVATGGLLTGSWIAADAVHDHFFGPAHPESATPRIDDPLVDWTWSGAVDAGGFTAVVQPHGDAHRVDVIARVDGDVAGTGRAEVVDGVARVRIDGLAAATTYRYEIAVDGVPAPQLSGRVRTFPPPGEKVTIAFSSCARTGSNGQVFDAIRRLDPDLYVVSGDLHYENIARNDEKAFARAYDRVLTAPAQAALYRSVPVAYVWDDHDYSGNDGDAGAASRPAARAAYERTVPHYALADEQTIQQAFSVGSVRVVMVDTRSARLPGTTVLGESQLRWLERELVASAASHDLVVWVSPTPWIGRPQPGSDSWAGFAAERSEVADVLADHGIDNVVIVGGDAHMVAIDDGTNSDYATDGGAPVPVLQAAALDRPGSVKGGPYSEGTHPGAGQFGIVTVEPSGSSVAVELTGLRYDGEVLVTHRFTIPGS